MNILNKFTIKNLKLNKKRTIVTITAIVLSTALICGAAGLTTSFQQTLIEFTKQDSGNYHTTFKNVPKDELKYIENNRNVSLYSLYEDIGYSELKNTINENKPYLHLLAFDKNALENLGIELINGRKPANNNEILVSQSIEDNARVKYKIGDKITLDIGNRIVDGEKLNEYNPYLDGEDGTKEHLEKTFTKEYTVVGVIKRINNNIEPYNAAGYTVITYLEKTNGNVNISVLYKNPMKYLEITKEILEIKNGTDKEKYETIINNELLRWEGANLSDGSLSLLYWIGGIVIGIIVLSSILVIRNSFAISITEKMKQYGMFASIGATKKQIKNNVLLEGLILAIIGIPIGIACGILAVIILIWIVNLIMAQYMQGITFIYSVPILPIILSIILAAITILLSSISSARKASKISPIEAIRSNNDIKIKAKKIKSPKIIKKIFKIGGEISYKNLKRNKKQYRTTVISLVVSIVIFISLSTFITYGFKVGNMYYTEIGVDLVVRAEGKDAKETYEQYLEISKMNNIEAYTIHRENILEIDFNKYASEFGKKINNEKGTSIVNIPIISIGDKEYKNYVEKIGGKVENYENGAILIDDTLIYIDNKKNNGNIYNVKAGETITGEIKSINKQVDIKIMKRTEERPMGLEGNYSNAGYLIVSDKYLEKIGYTYVNEMYIKSTNTSKLFQNIVDLENSNKKYNFDINNIEEIAKANNALTLIISIFLYGFITVISLIGITNIFNTITTNMNLRSKEFAMLKSIGMTKKEFNKMISLESIFYGVKSLIIGLPIGLGLSYFIYTIFKTEIEMNNFIFPTAAVIISIIFVFIIIGIIMKYSLNKINKQNIIETIRNDNI